MEFPDTLRYTKEHEWVRVEEEGKTVVIGITDFAQSELGDIVFVELDPVGTEVDQDETFGSVEAVKAVSDLYMPVAGTIVAHNDDLDGSPELVNDDPYGAGWMIKVDVRDPSDLGGLMSAGDYAEMIA